MISRWIAASAVLLAMGACGASDPTGATVATPALLVRNTTCDPGPCAAFEVRGNPAHFPNVPGAPPGGYLDLGPVTGPLVCLRFPASKTLTVIAQGAVTSDTMISTWTIGDSLSLDAVFDQLPIVGTTTTEFVPARSPGWTVTFSMDAGEPTLAPSDACRP